MEVRTDLSGLDVERNTAEPPTISLSPHEVTINLPTVSIFSTLEVRTDLSGLDVDRNTAESPTTSL
jgi:hypothetical protein